VEGDGQYSFCHPDLLSTLGRKKKKKKKKKNTYSSLGETRRRTRPSRLGEAYFDACLRRRSKGVGIKAEETRRLDGTCQTAWPPDIMVALFADSALSSHFLRKPYCRRPMTLHTQLCHPSENHGPSLAASAIRGAQRMLEFSFIASSPRRLCHGINRRPIGSSPYTPGHHDWLRSPSTIVQALMPSISDARRANPLCVICAIQNCYCGINSNDPRTDSAAYLPAAAASIDYFIASLHGYRPPLRLANTGLVRRARPRRWRSGRRHYLHEHGNPSAQAAGATSYLIRQYQHDYQRKPGAGIQSIPEGR